MERIFFFFFIAHLDAPSLLAAPIEQTSLRFARAEPVESFRAVRRDAAIAWGMIRVELEADHGSRFSPRRLTAIARPYRSENTSPPPPFL
jgi:hypothetical protein